MIIAILGLEGSIHTNKILTWFVEKGHEVHMISRETSKIPGVNYHNIDKIIDNRPRIKRLLTGSIHSYKFPFGKISAFKQLLRDINPDVLYSYTLFNCYPGYLGLFSNFHPYVITPLNGDLLWELIKRTQMMFPYRHKYMVKMVAWKADHLTASTIAMKDSWIKHGASQNKITMVVDPGTDTTLFRPRLVMNSLREDLGLNNYPVVLSTRSLGTFYNIDIIIKAIPKVLQKVLGTKFVFIWYGASNEELKNIKDLINQLDVGNSVKLIGKVDYSMVPQYFNMSDVFVSLSSCDTVPNSLLEAMASCVPPVCADLPPINEWIKNGENGFVVAQRDPDATARSIIKLLLNPSLREEFSRINVIKVREEADFEKQMIKLENIFKKLINENGLR